jgi:carbohydrate diacid regulator
MINQEDYAENYSYSYFGKINTDQISDNTQLIDSVYRGILGAKDEEVFYKACIIGYTMGISYYVIMMQLDGGENSSNDFEKDLNVRRLIKGKVQLGNNVFSTIDGNRYILFFNAEHLRTSAFCDECIVEYFQSLEKKISELGYRINIAIGSQSSTSSQHYRAIYDAQLTLKLMMRKHPDVQVGIINDYLMDEIFLSADKRTCDLYVEKMLEAIKAHDSDGIMINTIRNYCEQGFKKNETSKKLNIHRNTLEYRLSKIQSLLNIQQDDYKRFIQLYLGILIEQTYNR